MIMLWAFACLKREIVSPSAKHFTSANRIIKQPSGGTLFASQRSRCFATIINTNENILSSNFKDAGRKSHTSIHSPVVKLGRLLNATIAQHEEYLKLLQSSDEKEDKELYRKLCASSAEEVSTLRQKYTESLVSINEAIEQYETVKNVRHFCTRFTVCQYNILASYLGLNMKPWFLYGVDLTGEAGEARRRKIFEKYYERDAEGNLMNKGFLNYVQGILTEEEIRIVEDIHEKQFKWSTRKKMLLKTIQSIDSDVLSLVELDKYEDFFMPEMSKLGYDSIFVKRPRPESRDGCGIFWKRHLFYFVDQHSMNFVDGYHEETGKPLSDRCCLVALLRSTYNDEAVLIVSVHLARDPHDSEKDYLRGKQMVLMTQFLSEFAQLHKVEHVPVIVCGDVNAVNFAKLRGIAITAAILGKQSVHPFMYSFKDVPSRATSVTTVRSMRIDALLYQATHLNLIDMSLLPKLRPSSPIPNQHHPSDHLPIKATFQFKTVLQRCNDVAKEWWTVVNDNGFSYTRAPLDATELEMAFIIFDYDGTGSVDINSLRKATQQLQINSNHGQLMRVLSGFDAGGGPHLDPHATLSYTQFCAKYFACSSLFGHEGIEDVFRFIDGNSDGKVTKLELLKYFKIFRGTSFEVTEDDAEQLFQYTADHLVPTGSQRHPVTLVGADYKQFLKLITMRYVESTFPKEKAAVIIKEISRFHATSDELMEGEMFGVE